MMSIDLFVIVPEFNLTPNTISVTESNMDVQICITLSGSIDRNVIVTAQTTPKVGARNQATGE